MSRLHGDGLGQPVGFPLWGAAWGVVGRVTSGSTAAVGAALADTALTVTINNAMPGRLYLVQWQLGLSSSTTGLFSLPALLDGVQLGLPRLQLAASVAGIGTGIAYTTMTAGSHIVKVQASMSGAGGTLDGGQTHWLVVSDVGPA